MNTPMMRVEQVASYLKCSRAHVYNMEASGEFPRRSMLGKHQARWSRAAIDRWLLTKFVGRTQADIDRGILKANEVAEYLQISESNLRSKLHQGTFVPGTLISENARRWLLVEIEEWVQRGTAPRIRRMEEKDRSAVARGKKAKGRPKTRAK